MAMNDELVANGHEWQNNQANAAAACVKYGLMDKDVKQDLMHGIAKGNNHVKHDQGVTAEHRADNRAKHQW